MSSTDIGNRAETVAADFLEKQGFRILARNWRTRWCEIDIIAQRGGTVCFVEVKYRADDRYGDGLAYITESKQRQLQLGAQIWQSSQASDQDFAFVGIAVTGPAFRISAAQLLT